jgi:hypothetical protein
MRSRLNRRDLVLVRNRPDRVLVLVPGLEVTLAFTISAALPYATSAMSRNAFTSDCSSFPSMPQRIL